MDITPFSQRLRAERQRRGLTIVQLAERAECAKSTQHSYETSARIPDVDYLTRLWRLGFDPAYLVTGESVPTKLPERADVKRVLQALKEYEKKHGIEIPTDLVVDFLFTSIFEAQGDTGASDIHVDRMLRLVRSR